MAVVHVSGSSYDFLPDSFVLGGALLGAGSVGLVAAQIEFQDQQAFTGPHAFASWASHIAVIVGFLIIAWSISKTSVNMRMETLIVTAIVGLLWLWALSSSAVSTSTTKVRLGETLSMVATLLFAVIGIVANFVFIKDPLAQGLSMGAVGTLGLGLWLLHTDNFMWLGQGFLGVGAMLYAAAASIKNHLLM